MLQITVYVDLIFIVNFIADFFVIFMTGLIGKRKCVLWRMIVGALFGAGFLLVFILCPSLLLGWKGIAISVGTSMGMIAIAFGTMKGFFVRIWFLSTTIMFLTGAIMNYLRYIFRISVMQMCHWSVLFGGSTLIVLFVIHYLRTAGKKSDSLYLIQIKHANGSVIETTYMDTGNMLKDPLFQKPVIILSEHVLSKCLTEEELLVVEQYQKNGKLDYSILLTCQMLKKSCFHEVAYQSVGNPSGKMLCMLVDEVKIIGEEVVLRRQPVAIAQRTLFEGREYQGLLHSECIEKGFGG